MKIFSRIKRVPISLHLPIVDLASILGKTDKLRPEYYKVTKQVFLSEFAMKQAVLITTVPVNIFLKQGQGPTFSVFTYMANIYNTFY